MRTIWIVLLCVAVVAVLLIAGVLSLLKKVTQPYPALPKNPETGKWYTVSPDGAKSSDGSAKTKQRPAT